MSREQYTFDQASCEHRLDYIEEVPPWWLRREGLITITCVPAIVIAVFGLIFGFINTGILSGGFAVFMIWRFGGWRNKFSSRITVNETSGLVVLESGYRKKRNGQPHRFNVMQVASVERSSYAQEYPDAISHMQSNRQEGSNAADLAKARQFEVVKVVFGDGQEIDISWHYGVNNAAALHKAMIDLFAHARQSCQTLQQQEARLATLVPGDAPL